MTEKEKKSFKALGLYSKHFNEKSYPSVGHVKTAPLG
jgi:hypothetical protein